MPSGVHDLTSRTFSHFPLVEEGELDPEESLVLYGLDSLSIMRFTAELKAQGVDVGFDELARRPTLSAWWALLSGSQAA
ncbi:phosphopantetheine-binding protein [Aeromonas sp. A35_P]|uniref:phosphopantetheine-binding protein n=1 Tax=Aeromonas sp. A35_P TaxID=1983805 RepID=UPI0026B26AAD|nr:phosphopantetheine-binding protein [Aeromonas sp. A35_P]